MAFTFIMQTIAANLGGMLTPFGNPQNLYLYGKFQIPDLEFISTMFFAIFIFHYFNYHYLFDFCEIYTYENCHRQIRKN